MNVMKTWLLALVLVASPSFAHIDRETASDIYPMLLTAKLAGACGALKQLAYFQETTQMPNGTEFIERYFNFEAARLGKTLEEYLIGCQSTANKYGKLSELFKELSGN